MGLSLSAFIRIWLQRCPSPTDRQKQWEGTHCKKGLLLPIVGETTGLLSFLKPSMSKQVSQVHKPLSQAVSRNLPLQWMTQEEKDKIEERDVLWLTSFPCSCSLLPT